MRPISKKTAEKLMLRLGHIVNAASPDSALEGLTRTTQLFAALLDVYAQPNPENPQGMCDDLIAFRQHFANILVATPILRKKRAA